MWQKLTLLIIPAALVSMAAIAIAAPQPAPPQKPLAIRLVPPLQPYQAKPGTVRSIMPNMTQMPNSHIVAAFVVTASGHGLVMDTSGKVIGESELAKPSRIVWHDSAPAKLAPKPKR